MHKTYRICLLWLLYCGLFTGIARAETFHLTDGQTVTGDIVSMDDKGVVLKLPDGTYADRLSWMKISQADLKNLQQNPKAADFVEPYIEPDPNEKLKQMEIEIKPVPRLPRPAKGSLLGAMFTSSLGLITLLLLYAGNLYAAYEISIFRAQPAGMVCGIAAIAPVLGPVIFLSMPTKLKNKVEDWHNVPEDQLDPGVAAAIEEDKIAAAAHGVDVAQAPPEPTTPKLPPTKTFARGQFTFNRRFFETQLAAFFGMTRPEAEKDKVLTVKAARGTYVVQRISRISSNEMHLLVVKGPASEEVIVPFVEIQEVQLKHKDA